MPLVIDASVAFKWFVPEIDRDTALALLDGDEPLWAPDLVLLELGNALFGRLRILPDGAVTAAAAVGRVPMLYTRLLPATEFVDTALQLAFELRHPIYDCVYLALCEKHDLQLVTADERFANRLAGTSYAARLRLLGP